MDQHSAQDIQFHEATAADYDQAVTREFAIYHGHWLDPMLDRLATEQPGARVLDMGTGTGVVALALAERGFVVTAVDHSPAMLELAAEKARARGLEAKLRFERGDVTSLPFRNEEFAVITCQGLLHHLHDLEPCLLEARRLLAPDGLLYVSDPCIERTLIRSAFDLVVEALLAARRTILRRPPRSIPATVEAPISGRRLAECLRDLGFAVSAEYMTHLPFLHFFLPDSARLLIARLVSWPWRRHKGDLVFVLARKPSPAG